MFPSVRRRSRSILALSERTGQAPVWKREVVTSESQPTGESKAPGGAQPAA